MDQQLAAAVLRVKVDRSLPGDRPALRGDRRESGVLGVEGITFPAVELKSVLASRCSRRADAAVRRSLLAILLPRE